MRKKEVYNLLYEQGEGWLKTNFPARGNTPQRRKRFQGKSSRYQPVTGRRGPYNVWGSSFLRGGTVKNSPLTLGSQDPSKKESQEKNNVLRKGAEKGGEKRSKREGYNPRNIEVPRRQKSE